MNETPKNIKRTVIDLMGVKSDSDTTQSSSLDTAKSNRYYR